MTDNFILSSRTPIQQKEAKQHTLQEVLGCAVQIGWQKEMAEEYFLRRDSVGWIDAAHRPIRNLSSDMRLWQLREYIKPKAEKEPDKWARTRTKNATTS